MYNKLLSIGPFTLYTYGLMIGIGILVAFYVADRRGKALGMDTSHLDSLALWSIAGGFVCSKLLFWLTQLPQILQDPMILLDIGYGWVVYGGIVGGILTGWWYCRIHHMDFWAYLDLVIPSVALAQGFGRIGCFFAGCCYGLESNGWWSVTFPAGSEAPAGIPLFPVQLLSSACDFALFGILLYLSKKEKFTGELGAWYLVLYSAGRFLIEFLRGDLVRGKVGILTTSQFISVFTFAAGCILLYWGYRKKAQKEG